VRRAVDLIQKDIRPFFKYMLKEVPSDIAELSADDFFIGRFRYIYPRPYTPEEYDHIYNWMVDWNLLSEQSTFDKIVEAKAGA
jgi:hypothetical protein